VFRKPEWIGLSTFVNFFSMTSFLALAGCDTNSSLRRIVQADCIGIAMLAAASALDQ
jgi:hypothetical protein